jgi:hypothetical protein
MPNGLDGLAKRVERHTLLTVYANVGAKAFGVTDGRQGHCELRQQLTDWIGGDHVRTLSASGSSYANGGPAAADA